MHSFTQMVIKSKSLKPIGHMMPKNIQSNQEKAWFRWMKDISSTNESFAKHSLIVTLKGLRPSDSQNNPRYVYSTLNRLHEHKWKLQRRPEYEGYSPWFVQWVMSASLSGLEIVPVAPFSYLSCPMNKNREAFRNAHIDETWNRKEESYRHGIKLIDQAARLFVTSPLQVWWLVHRCDSLIRSHLEWHHHKEYVPQMSEEAIQWGTEDR